MWNLTGKGKAEHRKQKSEHLNRRERERVSSKLSVKSVIGGDGHGDGILVDAQTDIVDVFFMGASFYCVVVIGFISNRDALQPGGSAPRTPEQPTIIRQWTPAVSRPLHA